MAKKRSGNGSNLGLIITLIFFVLSTTILGVTTYLGFSNQEDHIKAKQDAESKKVIAENDFKYQRMQARVYAAWMGHPANKDLATEIASQKKQFEEGQFAPAKSQPDKEEVLKRFKALGQAMPWEGTKDAPSETYEKRLADLVEDLGKEKAKLQKAETMVKTMEREKKELEEAKDKEIAALKLSVDNVRKNAATDRQTDLNIIAEKQTVVEAEGKKRADLAKQKDDASRNATQLTAQIKELQGKITKATKDMRELRDERDDYQTRLTALYEKTGLDIKSVEAAQLDAQARKVLDSWTRTWRVVELDRRGEMPFVSLGSADGLTPQVTFSIHSVGPNGKLNPNPKGTVEIIRVMGAHLAQARVTSIRDAKKDPILKGDRLFNPTWDPNRQRHVAIAGIGDMGGDGNDSSEDLRRLLGRQKVVLDAYIDTKDDKAPKVVGKIGVNTDYLIMGESLEAVRHAKGTDKEYSARFDRLIKDLKEKAAANGVAVISLRRYLDMIGYQPPKIVTNSPTR